MLLEQNEPMKIDIPDFSSTRILVAGDVMLDRYWVGDTARISPEAPVPIVNVRDLEERAGGAANVAVNIAALGCQVSVTGVVGKDENATKLSNLLETKGVLGQLTSSDDCETIAKLRVLSRHQQLIRLDFEAKSLAVGATAVADFVGQRINDFDLLVLSDYAKGSLNEVRRMIDTARKAGRPVVIDPKGTDFDKYQGATLLTPNQGEFESIVGQCENDTEMESRARDLVKKLQLGALLVTRGDKGMLLVAQDQPALKLSARARDVYDVTGAGDTVVGVLAACIAAGKNLNEAAALANIAAGISVTRLGAHSVTLQELENEILTTHGLGERIVSRESLIEKVKNSRIQGEKIVFTNGCFDLLHAGHVTYLQQAASLGDRLIVAVNDDLSVQRLKGSTRPLNSVENRMLVLAALSCVDWVVPFSEDTPRDLIGDLLPDVLVKGGDYKPGDIAGNDIVVNNGGTVEIIPLLEGISTSSIIKKVSEDKTS